MPETRTPIMRALQCDHRVIERFLDVLGDISQRVERNEANAATVAEALQFIDEFVERYHHIREEHVLFCRLAATDRTFDRQGDHLTHCHDECREQLEGMRRASGLESPALRTAFAWNASAWIKLMREHLEMEENHLFPRIDEILTPEDVEHLFESTSSMFPEADAIERRAEERIARLARGDASEQAP